MGVTRYWRYSKDTMQALIDKGLVVQSKPGSVPHRKYYLDEGRGVPVQSLWDDISNLQASNIERTGYATQKPEALLDRIINASSEPGGLVADVFCGSGTTAAVAEKLGRRWIVCDMGRFAIHTTRKRLLELGEARPFVVQNLGKYERQLWQTAEFGETAEAKQAAYRQLILDLYHANAINGYSWLHGVKGGRMIHVGAVDSPISLGDITQIASEFKRAVGTGADAPKTNGVDVLGWDFAFELNEVAKQKAAEANVDIRFLRIPHDVMDKRARDQGDIRFFELAALSVESKAVKRKLTLTLTDFVIPPDDVPEDIQRAITKWEQWIDYWAVDWDNKGDTFHNQSQDYRTRKKRDLLKTITQTYDQPGEYVVAVKVIDILGNDTTKTLKVAIK
jgi:SAM-dependent methyltransferase